MATGSELAKLGVARPRPQVTPRGVTYGRSDARCASFRGFLEAAIAESGAENLCDVGGGANPMLEPEYLDRRGLRCAVLDIAATELDKAPRSYRRIVADIGGTNFAYEGPQFDLAFSRMLAEHVRDGEQFHRNVLQLLAPGGWAVHCFPTLYALPFVVNRLLPERTADRLLARVQPRDRYRHAKFPAYYSWCRGPGKRQLGRLEGLGYEVIEYRGLFGHPYYGERGPLAWLEARLAEGLARHPLAGLTSYAYLALRKR